MSDFPVLDAPRSPEIGRVIMSVHGHLEPYVDEMDYWCSMPIRLAHTTTNDWCIEMGPYTLDATDIFRLIEAIDAWRKAVGR